MNRKPRMLKLSLGFVAAIACAAAFVSTPTRGEAACFAVCTSGYCCCGKLPAIDWCTKKTVCVSACATQ